MKALAVLIGLLLSVLGIVTLVEPSLLVGIGHRASTPIGLWLVALARLVIGVVLYNAAKTARTPTALRILGSLFIASGIITPFFGSKLSREIVDAWFASGPVPVRLWSVLLVALGAFIVYTLSDGRRAVYRPAVSEAGP